MGTESETRRQRIHDLEVTLWVGKGGVTAVTEELDGQLGERELVKAKFLRAARGADSTEDLAATLADAVDAELLETRGNTAVFAR